MAVLELPRAGRREPEPWGHVAAPELPHVRRWEMNRGDTWRPQSCPKPGGGSRCLDLKIVRGGNRSLGCRQKIHLVPITFTSRGGSTKVQTWFLSKFSNSSCMALTQLKSERACPTSRGSNKATKRVFVK
jgi:hypothetical protein